MSEQIIITSNEQLDALVAEKVMEIPEEYGLKKRGYWYRKDACGYTNSVSEAWRVSYEEAKRHEYPHDEPVTMVKLEPRKYSTDIAAAWQIVDKMAEYEYCPRVRNHTNTNKPWVCEIWTTGDDSITASSSTAPLAICLCALQSMGINVKLEIKP